MKKIVRRPRYSELNKTAFMPWSLYVKLDDIIRAVGPAVSVEGRWGVHPGRVL